MVEQVSQRGSAATPQQFRHPLQQFPVLGQSSNRLNGKSHFEASSQYDYYAIVLQCPEQARQLLWRGKQHDDQDRKHIGHMATTAQCRRCR
jgi:hypothetical protein